MAPRGSWGGSTSQAKPMPKQRASATNGPGAGPASGGDARNSVVRVLQGEWADPPRAGTPSSAPYVSAADGQRAHAPPPWMFGEQRPVGCSAGWRPRLPTTRWLTGLPPRWLLPPTWGWGLPSSCTTRRPTRPGWSARCGGCAWAIDRPCGRRARRRLAGPRARRCRRRPGPRAGGCCT